MEGVVEGILFVVGNEGIEKDRLLEILQISDKELDNIINDLEENYENINRGINIEYLANRYKLTTKKEHKQYYEKLVEVEKNGELSQSALETLAIIAYNSPVTRGYIDDIRGVDSSYQLRKLIYRNLVKEVGRSDLPGRPILYSVTDDFLDYLGLSSLEELPELAAVEIPQEELTDLYSSKYKEN